VHETMTFYSQIGHFRLVSHQPNDTISSQSAKELLGLEVKNVDKCRGVFCAGVKHGPEAA
jgi:hypothetical protein